MQKIASTMAVCNLEVDGPSKGVSCSGVKMELSKVVLHTGSQMRWVADGINLRRLC